MPLAVEAACSSLPLMGIGNRLLIIRYGSSQKASLPLMGIGNLGTHRSISRCLIRTHYPSWGSETWTAPGGGAPNQASLPLMGIGNNTLSGLLRVAINLITPHGDRKLSNFIATDLDEYASLPLMGIGNPLVHLASLPDPCSSLPLMGIGNPLLSADFFAWMFYGIRRNTDTGFQTCAWPPGLGEVFYPGAQ